MLLALLDLAKLVLCLFVRLVSRCDGWQEVVLCRESGLVSGFQALAMAPSFFYSILRIAG